MNDENDELITVDFKCYKTYFMKYWQGCKFFIFGNLSLLGGMICWMAADYIIGYWTT